MGKWKSLADNSHSVLPSDKGWIRYFTTELYPPDTKVKEQFQSLLDYPLCVLSQRLSLLSVDQKLDKLLFVFKRKILEVFECFECY